MAVSGPAGQLNNRGHETGPFFIVTVGASHLSRNEPRLANKK